jgi:DNA-binding HxlR family transcriptional regulator
MIWPNSVILGTCLRLSNTKSPNQDCPSDTDLLRILFQRKWRLRVLQEIVKGSVRLSQLRRAVPECSKKVLIDTFHGLEEIGWIERQEYSTKLRKVEYSLTPKCEQDVRRAIAIASNERRMASVHINPDASVD